MINYAEQGLLFILWPHHHIRTNRTGRNAEWPKTSLLNAERSTEYQCFVIIFILLCLQFYGFEIFLIAAVSDGEKEGSGKN
jgi:hypothetical protein